MNKSSLLVLVCLLLVCGYSFSETAVGTAKDFYERGCRYLDEGELETAVNEFTNAIDLDPDLMDARLQRGIAYIKLEKYVDAINDLSIVLSRDPENPKATYRRAQARFATGDFKGAAVDVKASLAVNKTFSPSWELLGDIHVESKDYQSALVAYTKTVEYAPKEIAYLLKKVRIELLLNLTAEAISDCDEILNIEPEFYEAYYIRSRAKKLMGDVEGALKDLDKGLEFDAWKNNPEVQFERGLCLVLNGDFHRAAYEFRTAAKETSRQRHRYFLHLVLTLLVSNRRIEAKETVLKALEIVPAEMTAETYIRDWHPIFKYIIGELTESGMVDHVIANIENTDVAAASYFAIGMSSLAFGKSDRALDALFKATDLGTKENPESIQARLLRDLLDKGKMECPPKVKTENEPAN